MKYCTNCGKPNEDDKNVFCKECGHPFPKETVVEEKTAMKESQVPLQNAPTSEDVPTEAKRSQVKKETSGAMSKKKKWGFISILMVGLLLIAGHFVMKSMLDPKKIIDAMDSDFQNHDSKSFLKQFDYDANVTANADDFYKFIDEQGWSSIQEQLINNATTLQRGDSVIPITDISGNNDIIKVNSEDVLGGLYHKISFEVIPVRVSALAPYKDIQFTTGENTTKLVKEEAVFIGKFLPGTYEWEANVKGNYGGTLSYNGEMNVTRHMKNNEFEYEVLEDLNYTSIYSNNMEATLYINGKSTKKTVNELEEIGPIKNDGTVTIQAKVAANGKEYETAVVKIKDSEETLDFDYITVQDEAADRNQELLDLAEEKYDEIKSFYLDYRYAYVEDYNNQEYYATAPFIDEDTELPDVLTSFFEGKGKDHEDRLEYDGQIESKDYVFSDLVALDENTFTFRSKAVYKYTDDKPSSEPYNVIRIYTINAREDSYVISASDKP